MKWLKRIFANKSRPAISSHLKDKITDCSIDEEDNISAAVTISINGKKLVFPINTNDQKLAEEAKAKEVNKANPNSCEHEPSEGEIKVPVSFFVPSMKLAGCPISQKYFGEYIKANACGYNYMIVKQKDYQEACEYIVNQLRREYVLQRSARLNLRGIEYEKKGNIEEAIKVYEESIAMRSNGRHSYDRLAILYRKNKDKENEIRVLKVAVDVFGNTYKERLEKAKGTFIKPNAILPKKSTVFYWENKTFGEEYQETKLLFPEFEFYSSDNDKSQSFLKSEYRNIIWRIQDTFNKLLTEANLKEHTGRFDEAAVIYERIVSQQYWQPHPYDRLIKIYARAKLKEDEKRIIILSINYFSKLRAQQQDYVLNLARKYDKLSFVKERIETGKKITYYLGAFELYNPYPIIEQWKVRLEKLHAK